VPTLNPDGKLTVIGLEEKLSLITGENPERGFDDDAEIEYLFGDPTVPAYGIVNEVAEVVTSLTVFIVIATWVTITRIDDAGLLSHPSVFLCVTKYVLVPADEVEGIVAVALELGLGADIGLVVPYHLSSFPADAVAVRDVATSLRQ
jgi:hypothetical protein